MSPGRGLEVSARRAFWEEVTLVPRPHGVTAPGVLRKRRPVELGTQERTRAEDEAQERAREPIVEGLRGQR